MWSIFNIGVPDYLLILYLTNRQQKYIFCSHVCSRGRTVSLNL